MGTTTGISWTDATWNPLRGCTRVSEGCRHCYAEIVAARFSGPGQPYEGLAHKVGGEARWTGDVRFIAHHLTDPLRWRDPRRIFVNSMSDLFHEQVPAAWLDQIFAVMLLAPRHTFQVLTKRPEGMRAYLTLATTHERVVDAARVLFERRRKVVLDAPLLRFAGFTARPWPLPNVHLGVSVEHQRAADQRIPLLLETPAAVRWLSAEPLLGPIDLRSFAPFLAHLGAAGIECDHGHDACPICDRGIDWVVVGGESGRDHRPMDLAWARGLWEQCCEAYVPFYFKQRSGPRSGLTDGVEENLLVREFPR